MHRTDVRTKYSLLAVFLTFWFITKGNIAIRFQLVSTIDNVIDSNCSCE